MKRTNKIRIKDYRDIHRYLSDVYDARAAASRGFNRSAWAKKLGYPNSSTLSSILNGKRNFGTKVRLLLKEDLDLKSTDRLYFDALADLVQCKNQYDQKKHRCLCRSALH